MRDSQNLINLFVSVGAQVVWSANNFIYTMLLVRLLEPQLFGVFAILLAVKRGVVTLAGGLLVIPITVMSKDGITEDFDSIVHRIVNTIMLILFSLIMLLIVFSYFFDLNISLSVILFLVGSLLLDVNRRKVYIRKTYYRDFIPAILCLGLVPLLIWYLDIWFSGQLLNLSVGAIGISYCCAAFFMHPNIDFRHGFIGIADIKKLFGIGGWSLGSSGATYAYSEVGTLYTWMTMGSGGVALLELGRQFVAALQPILFGMANFFHPKIAVATKEGAKKSLGKYLLKLTLLQVVLGTVILLAMASLIPVIIDYLDRSTDYGISSVLQIFFILAIGALFKIGWQQPGFAMISLGYPKYAFDSRLIGGGLSILSGYFLTVSFGAMGAAIAVAVGDMIILFVSTWLIVKVFKRAA